MIPTALRNLALPLTLAAVFTLAACASPAPAPAPVEQELTYIGEEHGSAGIVATDDHGTLITHIEGEAGITAPSP